MNNEYRVVYSLDGGEEHEIMAASRADALNLACMIRWFWKPGTITFRIERKPAGGTTWEEVPSNANPA